MKEFTIKKNDAGQRLDRWLGKTLPLLPAPLAQKYIRLKRVKVNGKGSAGITASRKGIFFNYTSMTSFLIPPLWKMPSSLCSSPG